MKYPDRSLITVRPSAARGHADHGWLDTRHTFSFADYHDRAHTNFRTLRVINEDHIAPGQGFGTHPHRDMEIFSYLLAGALEHRDSLGNGRILRPGQIQLMSAGRGVTHSEFNPSDIAPAHLLQIWIFPREKNLPPSYTEWHPNPASDSQSKILVISPDGRDASATIQQDAEIHRLRLAPGEIVTHELRPTRGLWLQLMRGTLHLNDTALTVGDGASTEHPGTYTLRATELSEALLFDLG